MTVFDFQSIITVNRKLPTLWLIEEKNKDIEEILKKDGTELVIEENQASYEKIYNIGDNCWIKFEFEEEEIPDIVSSVKSKFIFETYALSRSGYKIGWQKYKSGKNTGKYKYTAKTTVNYGVASGTYSLRAYYQLTSKGVHVYKKLASGTDSGLLVVDVTDSGIDDAYATKPGASDCDLYATYKSTYGKDPIKWSRVHGMALKIKYLSKDTVEKEIKTTREWCLKSL